MAVKRNFSDSLFREIFGSEEHREYALSLYNAMAGTYYDDPAVIEVRRIDDAIEISRDSDASFLVGSDMVLFEHQSTPNRNMPFRGLQYFARLYERYVRDKGLDVYGRKRVRLPTPRYMVFYIGREPAPVCEVMRLSSSFEDGGDPALEVTVPVVNIGEDASAGLMRPCQELQEYADFIRSVHDLEGRLGSLDAAVDAALDRAVERDGTLSGYFADRRAMVRDMLMFEFTEEEYREVARRSALEEGFEDAQAKNIRSLMANLGFDEEAAMKALDIPEEDRPRYRELLAAG